ncbi:MAG: hypothetical protein ACJ0BJ_00125 [Pirellulales bacterium]
MSAAARIRLIASSNAIRRVGTACGLTSIVTAVGFASLAAARIEAVRTFGIAAAAGALASFAAVTLLTPLLASTQFCQGLRLGRSWRLASRIAGTLTAFSIRHARPIAALGLVGTLCADRNRHAGGCRQSCRRLASAPGRVLAGACRRRQGVRWASWVLTLSFAGQKHVSWRSDELLETR